MNKSHAPDTRAGRARVPVAPRWTYPPFGAWGDIESFLNPILPVSKSLLHKYGRYRSRFHIAPVPFDTRCLHSAGGLPAASPLLVEDADRLVVLEIVQRDEDVDARGGQRCPHHIPRRATHDDERDGQTEEEQRDEWDRFPGVQNVIDAVEFVGGIDVVEHREWIRSGHLERGADGARESPHSDS